MMTAIDDLLCPRSVLAVPVGSRAHLKICNQRCRILKGMR